MYLSKIYAMFKHDLEKIGKAVSKHSENIKGFGFSAKNLAENPKKLAGTWGLGDFWDVCNNPKSAYSVLTFGQSLPLNQILTNVKSGYFFSANFFGINPLTI